MKILGFDTAGPVASVALVENGKLLADESYARGEAGRVDSPMGLQGNHAEIILPLLQSILAKSGCRFDELDGIGISIGPGSFTGLRIGLATVKGLAYDCGLPVAGISTLQANASRAKHHRGLICPMLDARKREVYAALFRSDGRRVTRLTEDSITSPQDAVALVKSYRSGDGASVLLVGDGTKVYERFLIDALAPATVIGAGYASVAAEVGALAEERLRLHGGDDLGSLAPVYLRPSEAEKKVGQSTLTC